MCCVWVCVSPVMFQFFFNCVLISDSIMINAAIWLMCVWTKMRCVTMRCKSKEKFAPQNFSKLTHTLGNSSTVHTAHTAVQHKRVSTRNLNVVLFCFTFSFLFFLQKKKNSNLLLCPRIMIGIGMFLLIEIQIYFYRIVVDMQSMRTVEKMRVINV